MRPEVTAIILSREPVHMALPAGVVALNHRETFTDTAGIHMARRRALARVKSPWCFFLDSDDRLPEDAADVIDECVAADKPLVYTDESVVSGGVSTVRASRPYDARAHIRAPLMVHHLAMMRTADAIDALARIPSGDVWIEMLLYFALARRGVAYIPRVGYHWHRGATGMHRAPGTVAAQIRAAAWCARN